MIGRVKIGPMTYEIREQGEIKADDGTALIGEIDYVCLSIKLRECLPPPVRAVTLLHEIVHGVLKQAASEHVEDEGLVDCMAYGLYALIKDNPDLFREIAETIQYVP